MAEEKRKHQLIKSAYKWERYLTKGADPLERREDLKQLYDMVAHWEFLDHSTPAEMQEQGYTIDEIESFDETPTSQVDSTMFESEKSMESFLMACTKENIPGAREKLMRLREHMKGVNKPAVGYKVVKNNKEDPKINHTIKSAKRIQSGLLDKAENIREHMGSANSVTIYYDDVEYNFERADDEGWSVWAVDVETATDDKWGIQTGVSYSADELEGLFGYDEVDRNEDNFSIFEDGFEMEFQAEDEPEDGDWDDFEHQDYSCIYIRKEDSPWEEGDYLTNEEMYKLVDDIQNGNTPHYGAYIDEVIEPEDVL